MSQRATVSLTRELGFAIIRRQRWLTPERSRELMKAIEGATFDNKRKLNYATIDKVPGILQRLREAEFSVECDEDLMKAISEHETRTWIDIRAAKERAMKVDEELGKITDRITGKPLHLFPFQQTGIVWLATRYGGILGDEQGLGKEQPVSEPVLTPSGWKLLGEVRVGDEVFGADGLPTRVTGVFPQGKKKVYRVEMNDGAWTRCGEEHLWEVQTQRDRMMGRSRVLSLKQIMEKGLTKDDGTRFKVPLVSPLLFDKKEVPLDPYLLGALIANAHLGSSVEHSGDTQQRKALKPYLLGTKLVGRDDCTFRLATKPGRPNPVVRAIRSLGLSKTLSYNKFVPKDYLLGSKEQRLALLQGLMDNDGTISADGMAVEYNTTSPQLADDVLFLVRSLGGSAWMSKRVPTFVDKTGKKRKGRVDHRIRMALPKEIVPFRIPRKRSRYVPRTKYPASHGISKVILEPQKEESVCIRVEHPRHLYVTRDLILTHNTLSTLAALPANSRVVVVCPAVVKGVWKREIQQKRSHLRATVLEGKRAFVGWPKPGEVWLLNPEIMPETHTKECLAKRKDKKTTLPGRHRLECEIAKRSWVIGVVPEAQPKKAIEAMACKGCLTPAIEAKRCDGCLPITENVPEDMVLVYDEAHMFKNLKAQRTIKARSLARAVRRVGGRVWLLTGTPLLNRPEEMWALSDVALVAEEAFGSYDQFVKLLGGRPADGGYGWVWEGDPETAQVAERIERIMLRRRRVDVMPELPRKTFQIVPVEVDREALAACDAALAEYGGVDRIADMLDSKIEFKSISRIREALAKAKVPAMLSLIEEYEESGEPVVVASAHRAPIDALATRPGWRVITGDINASQRTEIEDAFQRGELKGVGCTIQSAGVGITLTRACHMIRVDSAWSPGINAQMDDRICRIGQTRPVLIRILAANHPLDERVEETLARKQHLIESTIDAAAQPPPPAEGGEAEDI